MSKKIVKQSGYPTTDGKMHDKYNDAVKHQSKIDLEEAVDQTEEDVTIIDFIKKNHATVSDFIKYHCTVPKKKAAPRKKAAADK